MASNEASERLLSHRGAAVSPRAVLPRARSRSLESGSSSKTGLGGSGKDTDAEFVVPLSRWERAGWTVCESRAFGALSSEKQDVETWCVRLALAGCLFAGLSWLTFGSAVMQPLAPSASAEDSDDAAAGRAGRGALLGSCLAVGLSQVGLNARSLWRRATGRRRKGEMVAWLSFWLFMDCLYYGLKAKLHPRNRRDPRAADGYKGQVFDERHGERASGGGGSTAAAAAAAAATADNFVLDFVADTGDGFNSCYSVASLMARQELLVTGLKKKDSEAGGKEQEVAITTYRLPRAAAVVHGGDIVYPFPSKQTLHERFEVPYSTAFPSGSGKDGAPRLYFVPGNHEWSDISSVQANLLAKPFVGGWRTPQSALYFALKLPHGWNLFGLDLGPHPEDIDEAQYQFFRGLKIPAEERIILVYHVPEWIKKGALDCRKGYERVQSLRSELGSQVRLVLAGDIHHYRRMEAAGAEGQEQQEEAYEPGQHVATRKAQFIVAGHGGAFSHATHSPSVTAVDDEPTGARVATRVEYPTARESRKEWDVTWKSMFFTTTNSRYMRLLAFLHAIMFAANTRPVSGGVVELVPLALGSAFFFLAVGALAAIHVIMAVSAHDTTCKQSKVLVLVASHTLGHVAIAAASRLLFDWALLSACADRAAQLWLAAPDHPYFCYSTATYALLAGGMAASSGAVLGALFTAAYLHTALNYLDWHWNEAIAAAQHTGHKGFLRIVINAAGKSLDVFAIGVDEVPTHWETAKPTDARPSLSKPSATSLFPLQPRLVERVSLSFDP